MSKARKFPFKPFFEGVKTVTAAVTLTKEDSGKLIVIDSTAAVAVTLPPVSRANASRVYYFQVLTLPASGGHAISPNAADKIFASFASSTAAADDKDLFFGTDAAGTGDKVGDFAIFISDGVDGWHVIGQGSFFREA